jgi:hypothetical protein
MQTPLRDTPGRPHGHGADDLLGRVRAEFLEMPGLQVTCTEASRLLGIEPHACVAMLGHLAAEGFLRVSPRGSYVRATS